MILRLIAVVVFLGVILGGIFGWKYLQMQQMAAQMSQPQPPAVVAATSVTKQDREPALRAVGSVTPTEGVFVANEIPGVVTKIQFRSAQRVKAGELLVQLDDSVDQAQLAGLKAERRLAELRFKRMERLLAQNSTSKSEFDQAEAELQDAEAAVSAKQAEIAKKAIRAPFDGALGIRQVDLGEYLGSGTRIVSLQCLNPIYVDFTLPERHLSAIHVDQTVQVQVQAYPEAEYSGQIRAIDPRINEGTRSVQVRAEFQNPEGKLHPGMFANVRVALPTREDVLTLPRTAVTYAPYGDSVFLIQEGEDGGLTVQRKQVQTGEVWNGRVAILEGLAAGDRVVLSGQNKLRNGQAVKIDNQIELETEGEVGPA